MINLQNVTSFLTYLRDYLENLFGIVDLLNVNNTFFKLTIIPLKFVRL